MIANVKEFKKKMVDCETNYKLLSKEVGIRNTTLSDKIQKVGHDLTLSETVKLANLLNLSQDEYFEMFVGNNFSQTK